MLGTECGRNASVVPVVTISRGWEATVGGWQLTVGVMAIVQSNTNLLQVVRAGHAVRRFAHFLHSRNQQANQNRNNRNHNEQLDQCETTLVAPGEESAHEDSLSHKEEERQASHSNMCEKPN